MYSRKELIELPNLYFELAEFSRKPTRQMSFSLDGNFHETRFLNKYQIFRFKFVLSYCLEKPINY